MTCIYIAYDNGVAVLRPDEERWIAQIALEGKDCQCLAIDPHAPQCVYCGTFESGLWQSDDAGSSWQPVAPELPYTAVTAVAVSPIQETAGRGTVWAGTEPSALFRSSDAARSWTECTGLQEIPSKPSWSFPPRPWTHHVRWIEPDATVPERIFAGIELGGVMRSEDNGETWQDRKVGSQHDCHTLRTHPRAPGVIYEAAGGGFAASRDGGDTWGGYDEGLRYRYLWGLAADPAAPTTIVVSASPGPRAAHNDANAQALLHRRSGDEPWQPVQTGLPDPMGTRAYMLATNADEPGVFYAATRQKLFRSTDGGMDWQRQQIAWPEDFESTNVKALVVSPSD